MGRYGSGSGGRYGGSSSRRKKSEPSPFSFLFRNPTTKFAGNLAGDVKDMVVGLPTGLVMLAKDPIESIENMAEMAWETWSPLFSGDFEEFAQGVYDHPLAPILDIASVLTLGAGGAARAARGLGATSTSSSRVARALVPGPEKLRRSLPDPRGGAGATHYKHYSSNPLNNARRHAAEKPVDALVSLLPSMFGSGGKFKGIEFETKKAKADAWRWQMRDNLDAATRAHLVQAAKNVYTGVIVAASKRANEDLPNVARETVDGLHDNFVNHSWAVDEGNLRRPIYDPGRLAEAKASFQKIEAAYGRPNAPLEGLPTAPGFEDVATHSAELRSIAAKYAQDAGITYTPPTHYVDVTPEEGAKRAKGFEKVLDWNDPKASPGYRRQVQEAYDTFAQETLAQYRALEAAGYRFEFYPKGKDPYPTGNPREAVRDLRNNKRLYVYPTKDGFGDADTPDHPLLGDSGVKWKGQVVTWNDLFRGVHDVFGHGKEGVGFRAAGEDNAWRAHAAMYSDKAKPAMTLETRGQNSWVNFGPHGEKNRTAKTADTVFAQQKVGLAPKWMMDEGSGARSKQHAKSLKATRNKQASAFISVKEGGRFLSDEFTFIRDNGRERAKDAIRDDWTIQEHHDWFSSQGKYGREEIAEGTGKKGSYASHITTDDPRFAARNADGTFQIVRSHDVTRMAQEAANGTTALHTIGRNLTNVWKWAVLAARPAYLMNNMVGNLFMYSIASGPAGFRGLADAVRQVYGQGAATRGLSRADKQLHALGAAWFERHLAGAERGFSREIQEHLGAVTIPLDETGKARMVRLAKGGLYDITHRMSDVFLRHARANVILRQMPEVQALMKKGMHFDDAAMAVLEDRSIRASVRQQLDDTLGQYHHMNRVERTVRAIVPFYTWDRAIARHGGHVFLDQPTTAAFMQQVGNEGVETTEEMLGKIPEFLRSALPMSLLGLPEQIDGRVPILGTTGLNPYATIGSQVDLVSAALTGGSPSGQAVSSFLHPFIGAGIEAVTGQRLLSGGRSGGEGGILPKILQNVIGNLPETQILDVATMGAEGGDSTLFERDLPQYLSAFLGVPIKQLNQQAAAAMAERLDKVPKKRRRRRSGARS